jgi:hypothetical protein
MVSIQPDPITPPPPVTHCISYLWTYDLYDPVRNVFEASRSITRESGRGWALGNETFLGPEMQKSEASAIWAQKIQIKIIIK